MSSTSSFRSRESLIPFISPSRIRPSSYGFYYRAIIFIALVVLLPTVLLPFVGHLLLSTTFHYSCYLPSTDYMGRPIQSTLRALVLTDVHVVGFQAGAFIAMDDDHWSRQALRFTVQNIPSLDLVMQLGDALDDGVLSNDQQFSYDMSRYEMLWKEAGISPKPLRHGARLLNRDQNENNPVPLLELVGNHDIGWPNHVQQVHANRWFNLRDLPVSPSPSIISYNNVSFALFNSMQDLANETLRLVPQNAICLTHFPLNLLAAYNRNLTDAMQAKCHSILSGHEHWTVTIQHATEQGSAMLQEHLLACWSATRIEHPGGYAVMDIYIRPSGYETQIRSCLLPPRIVVHWLTSLVWWMLAVPALGQGALFYCAVLVVSSTVGAILWIQRWNMVVSIVYTVLYFVGVVSALALSFVSWRMKQKAL